MGGETNSGGTSSGGSSSASGGKIVIGEGSGGKGAGTGGTTTEGWLEVCDFAGAEADPTEDLVIDDFDDLQDGFYGNGLSGGWYAYTDPSGGVQEPTGDYLPAELGGLTEDGAAMHISGSGQTVWGSGFGAILASSGIGQECLYDGSGYSGVSFWMRGSIEPDGSTSPGNPGRVRVKVNEKDVLPETVGGNCPTNCYDGHFVNVEVTECWQKYTLSFDKFVQEGWGYSGGKLDLDEIFTIEFGLGQGQRYDLWVDDLRLYVDDGSEEEPICEGLGGMGGMGGMGGGSTR
jgi:hypothetical protein